MILEITISQKIVQGVHISLNTNKHEPTHIKQNIFRPQTEGVKLHLKRVQPRRSHSHMILRDCFSNNRHHCFNCSH